MKLRIRGNALRLRLTRPEVAAVCNGETVENSIALGPTPAHCLTYRVQAGGHGSGVSVCYAENIVSVSLPGALAKEWGETDRVGVYGEEKWGELSLQIAVEKDFKCLDKRKGEDEDGAYPHPLTQKRIL